MQLPTTRRQCLQQIACGIGSLALADVVRAATAPNNQPHPHFTPRAKRVIFLFMQGGPSQLDLFDPKPFIQQKHGREHQPESFCAWMAGGGVRGGMTYGETDHMGYRVIAGKIHLHDLHATMLHQLGIDHTRLTWRHLGRDYRLTDVHGSVVKEILA